MNMVELSRTDRLKSKIYPFVILAESGVRIKKTSSLFLVLTSVRRLLKYLRTYCKCWKYKFALRVWLQYKNSKWIIVRWFHRTHNISFLSSWWCPWCNGYRRWKWTRLHEVKSRTRLIAFRIALIPLGKVWIQLFSLQLWVNNRTDWVLQPWGGN